MEIPEINVPRVEVPVVRQLEPPVFTPPSIRSLQKPVVEVPSANLPYYEQLDVPTMEQWKQMVEGQKQNEDKKDETEEKSRQLPPPAAPDQGRSALDAVEAMDHMVNMMREHIPQETRIHYVITNGGKAPNVIPDFAKWELATKKTISEFSGIYDILFIAHSAMKREAAGKPVKPLEAWMESIVDVEVGDDNPKAISEGVSADS